MSPDAEVEGRQLDFVDSNSCECKETLADGMLSSHYCVMLVVATTSALPHATLARLRGGTSKEPSLLESLASLKTLLASLEAKVKVPEGPPVAPAQAGPPVLVDPSVGDMVRVRPDVKHPKFDWGDATPQSVGRLVWYHEDRCIVDFPAQHGWNGLLSEMERVPEAAEAAGGAGLLGAGAGAEGGGVAATPALVTG
jgi:hypothetical protein